MDEELKQHLAAMEERLNQRVNNLETRLEASVQAVRTDSKATEHRVIEAIRNTQTELLRGFEAFSTAHMLRLRKVEANQADLDASLSGRVEVLEKWLLQIEQRLGGAR
jgi:hypothetical protein